MIVAKHAPKIPPRPLKYFTPYLIKKKLRVILIKVVKRIREAKVFVFL
jgi:hypothetical protein